MEEVGVEVAVEALMDPPDLEDPSTLRTGAMSVGTVATMPMIATNTAPDAAVPATDPGMFFPSHLAPSF